MARQEEARVAQGAQGGLAVVGYRGLGERVEEAEAGGEAGGAVDDQERDELVAGGGGVKGGVGGEVGGKGVDVLRVGRRGFSPRLRGWVVWR